MKITQENNKEFPIAIQETSSSSPECEVVDFPIMPSDTGNYRYFNQPIEQIPGWDAGEPQILFHGKNAGLVWVGIECVPVVTCATIQEGNSLSLTRKKLYVLKNAGAADSDCTSTTPMALVKYRFDEMSNQWILLDSIPPSGSSILSSDI